LAPSRFPTRHLVLDACALLRFYKTAPGSLPALQRLATLHMAGQVHTELSRRGASQRAAIKKLRLRKDAVVPDGPYWDAFCRERGGLVGTANLGEQESIAICVAESQRGEPWPLVTYDAGPGRRAQHLGLVVIDFLTTLAWCVEVGALTDKEANTIEDRAQVLNGWKRPAGYDGDIESQRSRLVAATRDAVRIATR
jgi:hypothetical protein